VLSGADDERQARTSDSNWLLQRQLPQITQRLQQTLAKLQKPQSEAGGVLPAAMWWRIQQQRYAHSAVSFASVEVDPEALLPTALFDSVIDNLLHNALLKAQSESGLQVRATLAADASLLSVCDTGSMPSVTRYSAICCERTRAVRKRSRHRPLSRGAPG
jgi:K+-sensing histidine kinase KdpD